MGKNKNKGFDLAKRQEKILKKLAKPLYKKADDSVYLVISQPFGMKPSPAERDTTDIGRLAAWISWVFRKQSVVDIVYTMSTRDEVIVKISEGVDQNLILGKHKYNDILSAGWPRDRSFASCVFEYNYQDNGNPADHNWREFVPSDANAPPGLFRDLCPVPTWMARPPYLASLANHLPDSLPRTPKHSPEPFYEASSHSREENVKQEQSHSLHAPAPLSGFAPGPVKVEPSGRTSVQSQQTATATYEPTQALRDEIARLNAGRSQATIGVKHEPDSHQIKFEPSDAIPISSLHYPPTIALVGRSNTQSLDVKQEPRDVKPVASDAGPSQELWNEWSRYQSRWQRPGNPSTSSSSLSHPSIASVEQGPNILPTMARSPTIAGSSETPESFDFNPRGPLPLLKVKREQTIDEDEQLWKRPKTEFN